MKTIAAVVLFALAPAAMAQDHHQPYATHEKREVKALSDDEAKQYLSGAGMAYAWCAGTTCGGCKLVRRVQRKYAGS